MTTDITVDDFMSGVIAACKLKGFATISMREDRFYQGIKASYDELVKKADDEDLDVRFVVHLDPLHQDSPVIGQAVTTAVQRKLVGLDNPEFVKMRIKMDDGPPRSCLNVSRAAPPCIAALRRSSSRPRPQPLNSIVLPPIFGPSPVEVSP